MKKTDHAIFSLAAALTVLLTACGSSRAPSGASSGDAILPSPAAVAEPSTPPAETAAPAITESPGETEAPAEQSAAPGETEAPEVDYEKIYRPPSPAISLPTGSATPIQPASLASSPFPRAASTVRWN